ncbi:MAG TPA: tetratricopeptide repeat protein, partial [bacterium]|nr:tetratricopeptide repeat protein [bacterium]
TKSINHNINNFAAVRLLTNYYFHLKKYGEYLELSALLLCNGQLTEKEKILFLEVLANTNNKKLINDYISYTFDKFKNADKNISEQLIRILKLSENKELLLSYLQSQIFENKNLDNAIYHLKIYYDELPQTYEKLWILETLLNYDNLLTDQEKYKYLTALENRYYQKKEYFKYEKLIEKYGIEKFDKEKLLKLADETQNKKLIYILKKYFYDNLDKFETRLAIEYFKLFNDYNGIINILDKNPRYLKNNNIFIDYCEAILNTPDFQKILPKLKQLSTAQNTNDKIDMLIAKIFEKNGDFNTAHKYYSNIKKLNNPQVEIAKILTMQTDDEKKLEHLKNLYSANKNEKYIINALYNFYIALADKYTNSNNFKKSEELLNTALKLIPANHDAYLKLANIFILQNKNDAALKILQNAAQYLPNNKEILLTFAQLYKKSAIFDEFKKILTILFVLYPYDSEISNLLITNGYDDIIDELKTIKNLTIISEFIHNEYAAELKYLQNANLKKEIISDIISVLSKHQYLTQLHYPLARLFLTNNEYQNAATYLKQYNAKFEIVEAQYYEGLCALKLNKNIDALKILKKLYETNTDNYRALEIYTFALHKNFMADELKQLLKSIQPKKYKFLNFNLFIDIYSSLIAENIKNNKLSEIAELIEDSKKFGESEKIKILQAHLYYKQNDLKNLTNIIYELQPTNSKQYKICETLKKSVFKTKKIIDSVKYYNNGNYKASYEILKDIDANIFAANPDALHYYLITLFKNGLYEKCENILNYHYNNFDYRYKNTFLALLAQIQIIQKKLDAAIKTLSQFLDLDIKDKKIKYLLLADIYFKMKKYHYAIENYEAAISIEQNQNALFNLSMAYYLIGNNATAKDIIQHLSENSWDTKEIKEFKSILF